MLQLLQNNTSSKMELTTHLQAVHMYFWIAGTASSSKKLNCVHLSLERGNPKSCAQACTESHKTLT